MFGRLIDVILFLTYTFGANPKKMDEKKKSERRQLESFVSNENLKLRVCGIENRETPDFELILEDGLISVEHTRLIDPKLIEVEQYRDKIIKQAQKRFEEKYPEKLYALITFQNIVLGGGKKAELDYVNHVYDLIEEVYLKNKGYDFKVSSGLHRTGSKLIRSFSVENKMNFSHWQHFGAYKVDWIDMKKLKEKISAKEKNIARYPRKYDENWLLMVSNFGTKASANRTDFLDFSVIESTFDKIYIYSYRENEITVVK